MNILVTGATGVIGRRLVPLLTSAGHDVTAVVRSPARRAALEREGAHCIELDLFDRFSASRAVEDRDAVINLATHMPRSSLQMALPWSEPKASQPLRLDATIHKRRRRMVERRGVIDPIKARRAAAAP